MLDRLHSRCGKTLVLVRPANVNNHWIAERTRPDTDRLVAQDLPPEPEGSAAVSDFLRSFESWHMHYLSTKLGTDPRPPLSGRERFVHRVLGTIVPRANPDFDDLYDLVRVWWLEVYEDSGLPNRELGLNEHGTAIVAAPIGENLGFWLDTDMTFEAGAGRSIDAAEFEAAWSQFAARFARDPA